MLTEILIAILITSLLTWALTDVYFYSIVFDGFRQRCRELRKSKKRTWFVDKFLYMLDCPFCFSHWAAAASMLILWLDMHYWQTNGECQFSIVTGVLLIPVAARIGNWLRDHSLPPITGDNITDVYEQDKQPQQPDTPEEPSGDQPDFEYRDGIGGDF
jgi:hypothetical protein